MIRDDWRTPRQSKTFHSRHAKGYVAYKIPTPQAQRTAVSSSTVVGEGPAQTRRRTEKHGKIWKGRLTFPKIIYSKHRQRQLKKLPLCPPFSPSLLPSLSIPPGSPLPRRSSFSTLEVRPGTKFVVEIKGLAGPGSSKTPLSDSWDKGVRLAFLNLSRFFLAEEAMTAI